MTVVAVVGVFAGVAAASGGRPVVKAEGTETFQRNSLIEATFHWSSDVVSVPSGGAITFVSTTAGEDPHTITIAHQDQMPSTIDDVFNCTVCNTALGHLDGNSSYDRDGDGGLSVPGDTWLLLPGQSLTVPVTASAGSTLYYLCAIHPWMQATIHVTGG